MKEKDIKKCSDTFTIKCYLMLKSMYWKQYALESMEDAPIFKKWQKQLF